MLRRVELAGNSGQHIHAGVRLALEQDGDVVAVHFDAYGFFEGDRAGLMRGVLEHGGETEELAWAGSATTTSC